MSFYDSLPIASFGGRQLVAKSCGDPSVMSDLSLPNLRKQPDDGMLIDLFVDETSILNDVDVRAVSNCSGKVHYLDYCEIATQGACTTDCPPRSLPSDYVRDWSVEKYRAAFAWDSDFLECNIKGTGITDTVLAMLRRKLRMEMEFAALNGDESLNTGNGQTRENNLLGVNDGWEKILTTCVPTCQVIDAACTAPSRHLYHAMLDVLPNRYHMRSRDYRFIGPRHMATRWQMSLTDRETMMGDRALCGDMGCGPFGTPFYVVNQWPSYTCGEGNSAAYSIWYTPLDNLVVYILRDMKFEQIRRPEVDGWDLYVYYRADFEVKNPDMVVLATNVSNCNTEFADCSVACGPACPSCPAEEEV